MFINCKGSLMDLSTPKVMGVVNLTPDSFYDGGKLKEISQVFHQVEQMLTEGAHFIDVGAYSSKPGAEDITQEEELSRLIPILTELVKRFPDCNLSVDTFRAKVAQEALEVGACLINDISAGSLDEQMMPTVAKYQVPYCMMHLKGTPQTMQQHTNYNDLVQEVNFYFSKKIAQARQWGINDCIIDPGFGFAKNLAQNYELLSNLSSLKLHKVPILIGVSRKSMIYKALKTSPQEALNGTSVLHTIALQKGANILRVHDVKEAVEVVTLLTHFN